MTSIEEVSSSAKKGNMGRAWAIVAVIFLAGFCMPANMGKTMWLAPLVMQSYGFAEGVLGWLNGVFYILGAVVAFPAASFVRKIGIRNTVVIALCCGIVGNIVGILSGSSVAVLMISRIIEGAGFGLMGVVGVTAIFPWFPPERRGLPLGIWAAWVAIANTVTPIIDSAIATATGDFMSVWWFMAGLDVVVLVLFLAVYRTPSDPYIDEADKEGEAKFSYKELFSNKLVWILAIAFFLEEGAFIASQGFFSAYVSTQLNAPIMVVSALLTVAGLWGAIFAPIAGKLSDMIHSRYKILVFCMVCGLIYAITIFWVQNLWLYIPVIFFVGITGGGIASLLWASSTEVVPSHLVSGATAALACFQSVGMFIGSMCMGMVVQAVGYTLAAWYVLVPCFLVGLIVVAVGLRGKLK